VRQPSAFEVEIAAEKMKKELGCITRCTKQISAEQIERETQLSVQVHTRVCLSVLYENSVIASVV
jgi:hypothetical protein